MDTEAARIELLEVAAAQNEVVAHGVDAPVLLRVAVNALAQADKFAVIGRSLLALAGFAAFVEAPCRDRGDFLLIAVEAEARA